MTSLCLRYHFSGNVNLPTRLGRECITSLFFHELLKFSLCWWLERWVNHQPQLLNGNQMSLCYEWRHSLSDSLHCSAVTLDKLAMTRIHTHFFSIDCWKSFSPVEKKGRRILFDKHYMIMRYLLIVKHSTSCTTNIPERQELRSFMVPYKSQTGRYSLRKTKRNETNDFYDYFFFLLDRQITEFSVIGNFQITDFPLIKGEVAPMQLDVKPMVHADWRTQYHLSCR